MANGRKPYLSTDYFDMMSHIYNKPKGHSEGRKGWLADSFEDMEYPHLSRNYGQEGELEDKDIGGEEAEEDGSRKKGRPCDGTVTLQPVAMPSNVSCSDTTTIKVADNGGTSRPPFRFHPGPLFKGSLSGKSYTAPACSENVCGDQGWDTVIVVDACGNVSDVTIWIDDPCSMEVIWGCCYAASFLDYNGCFPNCPPCAPNSQGKMGVKGGIPPIEVWRKVLDCGGDLYQDWTLQFYIGDSNRWPNDLDLVSCANNYFEVRDSCGAVSAFDFKGVCTVAISGPEGTVICGNSYQYTAVSSCGGGDTSFVWSVSGNVGSGGGISQSGLLTLGTGCCGAITIKAVSACGCEGVKTVRAPGAWFVQTVQYGCPDDPCGGNLSNRATVDGECIIGENKYEWRRSCISTNYPPERNQCAYDPTGCYAAYSITVPCSGLPTTCPDSTYRPYIEYLRTYKWCCPGGC